MDTPRIAALLEPFLEQSLSESQLDQVSIYIDLLLRWNARINLTAIRNEQEIVTRHFGESFFLASHLFPPPCHPERSRAKSEAIGAAKSKDPYSAPPSAPPEELLTAPRVLDIGSGAGFPALPIKIWAPHIHLTMIESNHKKATFLREVARALTLTNVNVITERAEALAKSHDVPQAEVVTLRAVEHLEAILPQAVTFLAPAGFLALLIGADQLPSMKAMKSVEWKPIINVPESHSRTLLLGFRQRK